jgi:Cas7 group CRISPR-associated protein Csh2
MSKTQPVTRSTTPASRMFPDFSDKLSPLLDLKRRFTAVMLVDIEHGIYNGDPNSGPRMGPRMLPDGHAYATPTSQRRILRDTAASLPHVGYTTGAVAGDKNRYDQLFVAPGAILNKNIDEANMALGDSGYSEAEAVLGEQLNEIAAKMVLPAGFTLHDNAGKLTLKFDGTLDAKNRGEALKAFKDASPALGAIAAKLVKGAKTKVRDTDKQSALFDEIQRRYFDVRWCGAVLSTGTGSGSLRAPFLFSLAKTVDPVDLIDETGTRLAVTREEDAEKKRQEMHARRVTPYALYRSWFEYSPNQNRANGGKLTQEDLRMFWTSLYNYGRFIGSTQRRPELVAIYVFSHASACGEAHERELLKLIDVRRKEGRDRAMSFEDYDVRINDDGVPPGIELIRFYERTRTRLEA